MQFLNRLWYHILYKYIKEGIIVKAKAKRYTAHLDYKVTLDYDLLISKIRIIDSDFNKTGTVFYEGTVFKFIEERIPAEYLVEIIAGLKNQDEISYRFLGGENIIQKIK
jgi:hypothetical protein